MPAFRVVTSITLLLIPAAAWVDVIRSSLGVPDMVMTLFMPMTMADGLAFVASWTVMMTVMMLPSALTGKNNGHFALFAGNSS
jgi:hypothetical protein